MTDQQTDPQGDQAPERLVSRIRWGSVALTLLSVAAGVLVVQNLGAVRILIFWWRISVSLVFVIVVTSIATLVMRSLLVLIFGRRRRRKHQS